MKIIKRNKTSHRLDCFNTGSIYVLAIKSSKIKRSIPLRSMIELYWTSLSNSFVRLSSKIERSSLFDLKFFRRVQFHSTAELHQTQSNERVQLSSKIKRSMWYTRYKYTLVQNGIHFIILLYPCKLALFASSACAKYKRIFKRKWGKEG